MAKHWIKESELMKYYEYEKENGLLSEVVTSFDDFKMSYVLFIKKYVGDEPIIIKDEKN